MRPDLAVNHEFICDTTCEVCHPYHSFHEWEGEPGCQYCQDDFREAKHDAAMSGECTDHNGECCKVCDWLDEQKLNGGK